MIKMKDELETHTGLIEKWVSSWLSRVEEFIVAKKSFVCIVSKRNWSRYDSMNKNDFISSMKWWNTEHYSLDFRFGWEGNENHKLIKLVAW